MSLYCSKQLETTFRQFCEKTLHITFKARAYVRSQDEVDVDFGE